MSPVRNNEVRKLFVGILLTLAVGGNGYFVKRLVDGIDEDRKMAQEDRRAANDDRERIVKIEADLSWIKQRLR